MNIFFNANNKATLESLQQCGVKNVLVSHRYSHNLKKFSDCFDNIFLIAGVNGEPNKYHNFLKDNRELYTNAAQFFVNENMCDTINFLKKERDMKLDTIPVLQQDFNKHLSQLNLPMGSDVCVGKMSGRLDMEESIRRLPISMKYHGLGKGKYINKKTFESIDTSLWISAALAKKFDIWTGTNVIPIKINQNNMGEPILKHYCEKYKDNMDNIGIKYQDVLDNKYYTMLKLPIALYYMPLCKTLNSYSDNFIKE